MSKTLLAPHWIPYHRDSCDKGDFAWWNPPAFKIITDADDNIPYPEDIPPGCDLIVRHAPSSDPPGRGFIRPTMRAVERDLAMTPADYLEAYFGGQGSGRDLARVETVYKPALMAAAVASELPTPEQLAERHAALAVRIAAFLKAKGFDLQRVRFEGLNEPLIWSVEPPELLARYERQRLILLHKAGLNGEAGNFGVGWPGNGGVQNAPVQWDFFKPVINVWGNRDRLGLHEYWYLNGPEECWGWWAGRFTQCPFDVEIDITEGGIDCGVVPGEMGSGWLRLPEPSLKDRARHYIRELARYEQACLVDGRIRSICVFTYDGVKEHWNGFNIRLSDWLDEFRGWLATRPELPAKRPEPPPVQQPDKLFAALNGALKVVDLRGKLPVHASLRYATRPSSRVEQLLVHHSAVALKPDRPTDADTWRAIARYHTSRREQGGETVDPWPGIGYHWGVGEDGTLYLLHGIDTVSYHAGSMRENLRSVALCFAGNYQVDQPTPAALATMRKAHSILEAFLGKAIALNGHRDVSQTACPGNRLYAEIHKTVEPEQPKPTLAEVLLAAGARADLGNVNPPAALHRAILAAGMTPASAEFTEAFKGRTYVCQVGRKPGAAPVLFYCPVGEWDKVQPLPW